MKRTIKLTAEQAREMLGKDETIDSLIRANFTEEELKPRVTKWEDLERVSGYYISEEGYIGNAYNWKTEKRFAKTIFANETQAEGVLAMAQLSQLMKDINGDWKPDWNSDNPKYIIESWNGKPRFFTNFTVSTFLAFPTPEIRDQFFRDHEELIKEYFKIYE